jgi:hypothetical protein
MAPARTEAAGALPGLEALAYAARPMSGKSAHEQRRPEGHSDGHPEDEVQYREHKLILRAERLATRKSFDEFSRLARRAARELEVALFRDDLARDYRVREVLFFDTAAFRLYEHSFILRRRTPFEDGWPAGETEETIKFRHADLAAAAAVDVRPSSALPYRIKFKEEILPARDRIGGSRSLYSHNCVATGSDLPLPQAFDQLAHVWPALARTGASPKEPILLVNDLRIEEVSSDVGELHFGHGLQAKATILYWRDRGSHAPLAAEFSFQCKFKRYDELHQKSRKRAEDFFGALQAAVSGWVQLDATKTGIVYRRRGGAPGNRE